MAGLLDPGAEPVQWAHRVVADDGSSDWQGKQSCKQNWQLYTNRPDYNAYQLTNSAKIPPLGESLYNYAPDPALCVPNAAGFPTAESASYSYVKVGAVLTDELKVANFEFKQDSNDPYFWSLTVYYERDGDPASLPPDISSEPIEYQVHKSVDNFGRGIRNSAFDPIVGGMPVDENQKIIKVVRYVPYTLWSMDRGSAFENTLNTLPFTVPRQVSATGGAVIFNRGTLRIKKITEREVLQSPSPIVANRKYIWQVSVDLHLDLRTIRRQSGFKEPVLHRFCPADAGFRQLNAINQPIDIYFQGQPTHEQQFLDGRGQPLIPPSTNPPVPINCFNQDFRLPFGPYGTPPYGFGDLYTCQAATKLIVPAPGIMANDEPNCTINSVSTAGTHGTVSVSGNGSFTYDPVSYSGSWDRFTYTIIRTADSAVSTAISVDILVTPMPLYLFFDRYDYADWSPLAPILAGW